MYHYADNNIPVGPVPKEKLVGKINAATLVWREGLADWVPAGSLAELADIVPGPTGSSPASAATHPPVPGVPFPAGRPVDYSNPMHVYPPAPGLAVASMVLGIVSIPTCFAWGLGIIPGILAVIFGFVARSQGAVGSRPGSGQALAGIILGMIPIVLLLGGIAVGLFAAAFSR